MNTSILNDATYIDEVKKKVLIWREEATWDRIKY